MIPQHIQDGKTLNLIYHLRKKVWADNGVDFGMDKMEEPLDNIAEHWAILVDDSPVASIRMSVHNTIREVPIPSNLTVNDISQEGSYLFISRLVVDSLHRKKSYSRDLIEHSFLRSKDLGATHIIAYTTVKTMVRHLIGFGFSMIRSGSIQWGNSLETGYLLVGSVDVVIDNVLNRIALRTQHK